MDRGHRGRSGTRSCRSQLQGFSIAYCVNVARPWDSDHPLRRLVIAVAIGALLGVLLVILVKQYSWRT